MVEETCEILKGEEVRVKLLEGSEEIAKAVSTTFGPYGRNVAITMTYNLPHVTKDGATVAGHIKLKDLAANVAAQIIQEAAQRTAKIAGDGTTSTTILTNEIVKRAINAKGYSIQPMQLKRDLKVVEETLLRELESLSKETTLEEIYAIAKVACNGDDVMANLVANAFKTIGEDGFVTVTSSNSYDTYTDAIDGIKLDRTHILPSLSSENKTEHKNCAIAVLDLDITSAQEAIHILELQEAVKHPLLVICNDLKDTAAEVIAYNKGQHNIPVEFVRGPAIAEARRESFKDLAIVTGATNLNKASGWTVMDLTEEHFGSADKVEITNSETNIIGRHGNTEEIEKRVAYYEEKIAKDTQGLSANFKKRLAYFTSGAAVIYVGGANEVEVREKKDRLDDTIRAVQSALKEGYVLGGGLTYSALTTTLEGETPAELIMEEALLSLVNQVTKEAGISVGKHMDNVNDNKIIDPTLVIKSTIQNAIAAATMVFTTDCIVLKEER
jgi:chaperonin GroEL